jgi:hypothetical protein
MWPFKRRSKEPNPVATDSAVPNPRYTGKPMLVLFESLILDTIGHLEAQRADGLAAMARRLGQALHSSGSDWRGVVKEALHLSPTIDIAILDLWIRNSEIADRQGQVLDPVNFSQMFADEYLRESSKIDIWPGDALDQARTRIAAWRQRRPDA